MIEPWRYECANGHRAVYQRVQSRKWWCQTCRNTFDFVLDLKTGERISTRE